MPRVACSGVSDDPLPATPPAPLLRLLDYLARRNYLRSPAVRAAMEAVDRRAFVPASQRSVAYDDTPLAIGHGQTISAPHMVAMMLDLLAPRPGERLLEIGSGCGYHAAVASRLLLPDGEVHTVERLAPLAEMARANLAAFANVTVHHDDGSLGLPGHAPYARIMVTCGAPAVPGPLRDQLAVGGRLVVPVGGRRYQDMVIVERTPEGYRESRRPGVAFVPLIGEHGFAK